MSAAGLLLMIAASAPDAQAQVPSPVVQVSIDQFGLGGWWRQGSIAPVRLNVHYTGNKVAQPALVVWEQPDADGDIEEISKPLTLNPGDNRLWLYVPVRFEVNSSTRWNVAVYAYEDDQRGEQLAGAQFTAGNPHDLGTSIIGVVGTRTANLSQYIVPPQSRDNPLTTHEGTEVLVNLQPSQLPDRWMGFSLLDVLVWTQGDPATLKADQARAIEQWVYRGGQLVVVLPQVGDNWNHSPLDPIMPQVVVQRLESFELRDIRSSGGLLEHLGKVDQVPPDRNEPYYPVINLHLFTPPGGSWSQTQTIPLMEMTLPPARPGDQSEVRAFVVQRYVGFGMVTLVGAPVADEALNKPGLNLPDAEVFWNRILSRRQDVVGQAELTQLDKDRQQSSLYYGPLTRERISLDRPISFEINLTSDASRGLLLSMIVFIAYWFISGPAIFGFLRYRKLPRLNWLAFVGVIGVFTGLCWMGASMMRANDLHPVHLTIMDRIADFADERTTSYITMPLSGYGSHDISVAVGKSVRDDLDSPAGPNFIMSFSDPLNGPSTFPDKRRYVVDSDAQEQMSVPARSTSKSFYISSIHPVSPGWLMPNYDNDADRPRIGNDGRLAGILTHELPGDLVDATVFYVSDTYRDPYRRLTYAKQLGRPLLNVYAKKPSGGSIRKGDPIDLSEWFGNVSDSDLVSYSQGGYFVSLGNRLSNMYANVFDPTDFQLSDLRLCLEGLSFFEQLRPPDWQLGSGRDTTPLFTRKLGRELDISDWFSRPCIIITGFITSSPIPYPLKDDGVDQTAAALESKTFLRWIYPLSVEHEPLFSPNDTSHGH